MPKERKSIGGTQTAEAIKLYYSHLKAYQIIPIMIIGVAFAVVPLVALFSDALVTCDCEALVGHEDDIWDLAANWLAAWTPRILSGVTGLSILIPDFGMYLIKQVGKAGAFIISKIPGTKKTNGTKE